MVARRFCSSCAALVQLDWIGSRGRRCDAAAGLFFALFRILPVMPGGYGEAASNGVRGDPLVDPGAIDL
jgi:hypothetical protein